jgi:hypothetical protein
MAHLTTAEREAAQKAIAKLKSPGGGLSSHLGSLTQSATVYGGSSAKTAGLGAQALIRGQGSDTFIGGARGTLAHAATDLAKDTVVGGSAATALVHPAAAAEGLGKHAGGSFSLSNETINVAGTTAESVKAGHPAEGATGGHTVTLADSTTVTITGLSQHDMSKIKH